MYYGSWLLLKRQNLNKSYEHQIISHFSFNTPETGSAKNGNLFPVAFFICLFCFAFIACSFFSINVYSQGMEDVFATYDLNQDEHLSLDEFSAYYNATAVAKCETAKPKRSAQFDEMDKNGDGILTRDESPIYISRYLSNPATASLIVNDTLSKEAFPSSSITPCFNAAICLSVTSP